MNTKHICKKFMVWNLLETLWVLSLFVCQGTKQQKQPGKDSQE